MSAVAERRQAQRHVAWFPVRVDAGGRSGTALAHNVSGGGILLAARKLIEVGSPVKLSLHVDPDRQRPREIEGRIVRMVRNSADPNGLWPYKLAVEFEDPDPELVSLVLDDA
jgi:hypothetical protein